MNYAGCPVIDTLTRPLVRWESTDMLMSVGPIIDLGGYMSLDQATERLVGQWFDLLSAHAPVAELLQFVSEDDLEMVFPERTLNSHEDFRDWYRAVGEIYANQEHIVENIDVTTVDDSQVLAVTVIWRAVDTTEDRKIAMRAQQSWHLAPSESGDPVIRKYRVETMVDL
jgi:hypothetical protein